MFFTPKIGKDVKKVSHLLEMGIIPDSKILAVFPHPDDETGFCAGFLQKSASENISLRLICATKGEKGNAIWKQATEDELAKTRTQELANALHVFGVKDYELWDFNDGKLDIQFQALKSRLTKAIQDYKPTHILSLEPWGIYGHPDHIALSKAATELVVELGGIRLIYATVSDTSVFNRVRDEMAKNPEAIKPLHPNYALKLSSKEVTGKINAFSCHKSQFDLKFSFFFRWLGRGLLNHEFYVY